MPPERPTDYSLLTNRAHDLEAPPQPLTWGPDATADPDARCFFIYPVGRVDQDDASKLNPSGGAAHTHTEI
eukprot:scaffold45007_cov59-Phaeocystis_antarctica.AAC.13